jgi:hypothetical protein
MFIGTCPAFRKVAGRVIGELQLAAGLRAREHQPPP